MKKVKFVFNSKEEIREYDNYVPDTQIDKDHEEWLLEQIDSLEISYWEEIVGE